MNQLVGWIRSRIVGCRGWAGQQCCALTWTRLKPSFEGPELAGQWWEVGGGGSRVKGWFALAGCGWWAIWEVFSEFSMWS